MFAFRSEGGECLCGGEALSKDAFFVVSFHFVMFSLLVASLQSFSSFLLIEGVFSPFVGVAFSLCVTLGCLEAPPSDCEGEWESWKAIY